MGINSELAELRNNAVKQKILDGAFRIFSEKGIEPVTMTDVAKAAGVGVATVYRYFGNKNDLVFAVGTTVWGRYIVKNSVTFDDSYTARQVLDYYLGSFLDLYKEHKDILRFNQFFNVYISGEHIPAEAIRDYTGMIESLAASFHSIYVRAERDGTVRTDVPEREMFSATLHLMLATVTRYAVGLVYKGESDPERELVMLKRMLMREYAKTAE